MLNMNKKFEKKWKIFIVVVVKMQKLERNINKYNETIAINTFRNEKKNSFFKLV